MGSKPLLETGRCLRVVEAYRADTYFCLLTYKEVISKVFAKDCYG
jgi:hypothetical protein